MVFPICNLVSNPPFNSEFKQSSFSFLDGFPLLRIITLINIIYFITLHLLPMHSLTVNLFVFIIDGNADFYVKQNEYHLCTDNTLITSSRHIKAKRLCIICKTVRFIY